MQINNWSSLMQFAAKRLNLTVEGKQKEILESTKQIKIMRCARRTGKSFNVALITYSLLIYSYIMNKSLNIIFGGPRSEDTRHMWMYLHKFLKMQPIQGLEVTFDNYNSQSTNKKKMVFSNGTKITNATCDNPEMDDIRGDAYDFLAVDEYGNITHKQAFMAAASQSLKDKNRLNLMMIIGTPDLGMGNSFDELMELGKTDNPKVQSWHLTESDCPFIDRQSANIMNSLLDEDGRLREVEGEAVPSGGKLFPEFHYNTQVVRVKYNPNLPYFIGIDFGRNKPIVEFTHPKGRNFGVFHEISCKDILIDNLIKEIELVIETDCQSNYPTIIGCDKAGKAKSDLVSWTAFSKLKERFPQATFTTSSQLVSKDNQTHLYRKLTKQNRIFIDPSCKQLVNSFMKATPNTKGQIRKPGWKKVEGVDDPLDGLMYGLINHDPGLILSSKKAKLLTVGQALEIQTALG